MGIRLFAVTIKVYNSSLIVILPSEKFLYHFSFEIGNSLFLINNFCKLLKSIIFESFRPLTLIYAAGVNLSLNKFSIPP